MRDNKVLSQEITALLNKVYNYRSEDSIRLVDLTKEQEKAEEKRIKTDEESALLKEEIVNLDGKLRDLNSQGKKLSEFLAGIDYKDYAVLLDSLSLNFNPEKLRVSLDAKLPEELEKTSTLLKEAKSSLKATQKENSEAEDTIKKFDSRIQEEQNIQAKLSEYLDIALTGTINVTREEITNLLKLFDFDDNEQKEIAKMLMFPEDALLIYDKQKAEKEELEATKEDVVETQEEIVEEDYVEVEEPVIELEDAEDDEENPVVFETAEEDEESGSVGFIELEDSESNKDEIKETSTKDGVLTFLSDYFDASIMPKDAIESLVIDFDESVAGGNIEYTRSKEVSDDIYFKVPKLLTDTELADKVDFVLKELAKTPEDILYNTHVLENFSLEKLTEIKQRILSLEIDARELPLYIYKMGMDTFLENVEFFFNKGIRFDAKSISKQPFGLAVNSVDNTKKIADILETYGLSITKSNGKNIIPILSKDARKFANELDLMIEIGQEKHYKSNPKEMCGEGL